jgi:hypothetical protein
MTAKILRTAPEIERLILNEMSKAAICDGVSAVTVSPIAGRADTNWEVLHISVPGSGNVPQVCIDICAAAVDDLRRRYDLLLEIEAGEL